MSIKESRRTLPGDAEAQQPTNDFKALLAHMQARPGLYIGAAAFFVAVLAATGIYRVVQSTSLRQDSTTYVRAMELESPAERADALSEIAKSKSILAARALYLEGEAALDAGNYERARAAFEGLRSRYPSYEFVPDAVEGLGFIAEEAGNIEEARAVYSEVATKWPDSSAAQRQPFNVARCFEAEDNLAAAVGQYRRQLEVFPGSTIAVRAQQRLNELRESHPELFAQEGPVDTGGPVLQEFTTAPEAPPAPEQLQLRGDTPAAEPDSAAGEGAGPESTPSAPQ